MSDRPDLDEAIRILQAGGIKITGGRYAPVDPVTGIKPSLETDDAVTDLASNNSGSTTDVTNPPNQELRGSIK